jgi:uncharacterized damage-inducible protein DinB
VKETQLTIETLQRAQERLEETLAQMTVEEANTIPASLIKSVTWLMWHTAREIDLQVAALAGREPLWLKDGWTKEFALDLPDDTEDWHHTPVEAAKVVVDEKDKLSNYLSASVDVAIDYLQSVDETSLSEIIDENWTPPVTRQARIVSIVDDAVMHSGQAIYTRRLVIGK